MDGTIITHDAFCERWFQTSFGPSGRHWCFCERRALRRSLTDQPLPLREGGGARVARHLSNSGGSDQRATATGIRASLRARPTLALANRRDQAFTVACQILGSQASWLLQDTLAQAIEDLVQEVSPR